MGHGRRRDFVKHVEEGRRGVRPKKSGHQQGRTERAPPRIHQRMEEAEIEGRGGAEASEGETDEEEGNPGRAREEIESGEEVGRREVEEDRQKSEQSWRSRRRRQWKRQRGKDRRQVMARARAKDQPLMLTRRSQRQKNK